MLNFCVELLVREVCAKPLSHAGDDIAEPMLAVVLLRRCW
jgi:hypothetical protein